MSDPTREMLEEDAPDNEWDTEVRGRTLTGEDEETVRAEVIARYLDACDPRPLISAIIKGRRLPATTIRRVAAIFDHDPRVNEHVPTVFGIRFSGRLRKVLSPGQAACVRYLLINQKALAEGRDPDPRFWGWLARALRCGQSRAFQRSAASVADQNSIAVSHPEDPSNRPVAGCSQLGAAPACGERYEGRPDQSGRNRAGSQSMQPVRKDGKTGLLPRLTAEPTRTPQSSMAVAPIPACSRVRGGPRSRT